MVTWHRYGGGGGEDVDDSGSLDDSGGGGVATMALAEFLRCSLWGVENNSDSALEGQQWKT